MNNELRETILKLINANNERVREGERERMREEEREREREGERWI